MTRVLHLHDADADYQTRRGVEALTRGAGRGFDARAETLGGGWSTFLRFNGRGAARSAGGAAVVHAWGGKALASAVLSGAGRIVYSPTTFPSRRAVRWLRAAMDYRDVQVVCATATQRRRFVEGGVPLGRCHLIRPGVDFARVRRRRDPGLRAALGFAEGDHVVFAPGESTRAAAHEDAVWAGAIASILDPRVKVLLWGRGERVVAAAARARQLVGGSLLSVATSRLGGAVEYEGLLAAVDSVMVTARGPVATLPIAVCMAAGLPIVSTVTYTVAELLEDRHTALMVPRHSAPRLARRLIDLREDAGTQWSIADVARTEAYEYFSLTRFLDQWRGVYRQVGAGQAVEVVEPQPGAGQRFHARV